MGGAPWGGNPCGVDRSVLPRACHKTPDASRDRDGTHGGAIAVRSLALRGAGLPAAGAARSENR